MKRFVGLVLVIALLLLTGCASGTNEAELDAYAAAARALNADSLAHQQLQLQAQLAKSTGKTYASIGVAEDYPDQFLVTIVNPGVNSATQFLFDPAAPVPGMGIAAVDADTLPESVKQWNATIDEQGFLIVDGREEASAP